MQIVKALPERKPDPDVISYLETALAEAHAGTTTGILLIKQDKEGSLTYTVAGIKDRFAVTGWLMYALNKLLTTE